jgi:DNA-binding Lrp family transcriptional regulator
LRIASPSAKQNRFHLTEKRSRAFRMRPVFVQLQCSPGKTYEVADEIFKREVASELYSTSGDFDLLMKIYIEDGVDIGKFINENVANVPGIVRSLTTLTFKAF